MNKEYRLDREYSVGEIIRYNLRRWWLAVICAAVCAAALGGYKFIALYPYVEKEAFEDIYQVEAMLYVNSYSEEGATERVSNLIQLTGSYRMYELVKEKTGADMSFKTFRLLYKIEQSAAGDVVTIDLRYPLNAGDINIEDENGALLLVNALLEAMDEVAADVIGADSYVVIDEPHAIKGNQEIESYGIKEEEFQRSILKAVAAGILLGIMAEVVLYTFWMLLYKRPKNAEEIRQCLDVPVIDDLKSDDTKEEEAYKKTALFLEKSCGDQSEGRNCLAINCMSVGCAKKGAALKLAMSFANEQKKTLLIDLSGDKENKGTPNSISRYILGETEMPGPNALNNYLDVVCRTVSEEKGFQLVMNERFASYINGKRGEYDYIVVNNPDVTENMDAYVVSGLCDRTLCVCARKRVTNEMLYRLKNTAEVNRIAIEGVLVYEL